jgi:dihydroflavonol-4-reductase
VNGPVFVTGGSGFVGGEVVRRLVERGLQVRALARSGDAAERLLSLGADPVAGDLEAEPDALGQAMRGCDVVFHVAGVNQLCARRPAAMYRANVDGAAAVIRAAADADVGRVVFTSSASTIGEPEGAVGAEDTVHRGTFLSHYERSKYLGERKALSLGADLGIDVVSVNPSSVQGPGRTGGTARLLVKVAQANTAALVRTNLSIVAVQDCAEAHLLAAERGRAGARYVVSGISLGMEEAVTRLRAVTGRPARVFWIPRAAVRGAAPLTALARGDDPPVCRAMLRTLLHGHRYDGSLATRELGLTYTPFEELLERTLAWYRAEGLVS